MTNYLLFVFVCALASGGVSSFNINETAEAIEAEGYHVETHYVTTHDGYILQVHRIPFPRHRNSTDDPNRPVVFLMHGLLSASNSFIILGHEYSLAYNLADAGCDVWMGNARGNSYSRFHVFLDPDDDVQKFQFFDFSWEEIGMIDVPAMVDYALDHTGQDRLHYIGHSQGGTVFLVMGSMRPEYNDKLASVHLLAGVGYVEHFPDSEISGLAVLTDVIYGLALSIGVVELFPPNSTSSLGDARTSPGPHRTSSSCLGDMRYSYLCDLMGVQHIMRNDSLNDLESLFEFNGAAGASLKQIAHYGQIIRDKIFRRWNYGFFQNLEVYNSTNPPAYDLSLITSNVTMHYTVNDNLLDERDVLAMAADMPNAEVHRVARDDFLHADFVAASDSKELVNERIIEAIHRVHANAIDGVADGAITVDEPQQDQDHGTDSATSILLSTTLSLYMIIYSLSLVF